MTLPGNAQGKPALRKLPDKFWGVCGAIDHELYWKLMSLDQLNPFCQSGMAGTDWCFIEFWCSDEALILDLVLEVAPDIEIV